ncbi:hypothetical protein C7H19_15800 [Aphanothece hegewaldii CCALA 016]|uniref:DUF3038 domain-containing protein n=2 Tax=Aphanothece TaxID=1121 RepID=A0A2T1LVJ5_9CHRO|nr:hypothetical protein C7H19_15800 [Aphanothece hegewaldii CCALA 016]
MSDNHTTAIAKPAILDLLPDIPILGQRTAIRLQQQIDLILLTIESLEINAVEGMFTTARELGLDEIIKNRIVFWRLRCTNSWRRSYNRDILTLDQAKALVILASYRAKQLSLQIRQLLIAEQQMRDKGLPVDTNFLLSDYLERFRANFRSRMNPRRAKVSIYLASEDELNELSLILLNQLLFCTGTTGMQRFWVSLFDGAV